MVQRTLMARLDPTPAQKTALLDTMRRFNAACDFAADVAFENRCANKFVLQKLAYRDLRERFGLSAQLAVRAIAKVCEAYKRDRSIRPTFRERGAVPYDQRILSWKGEETVSLLTIEGRTLVPLRLGRWQRDYVGIPYEQADLVYRRGKFFLALATWVPDQEPAATAGTLGVDLGVVNIAVDSDGKCYKGETVDAVRERVDALRGKLQSAGTRSAKRHLRLLADREARFRRDINHYISKDIVARAKGTGRGIALEELRGIRDRTTVRRCQRRRHLSWAYGQLRAFVDYKARLVGVPVAYVPPAHTSQTCPACGHVARANRKRQAEFRCVGCGHAGPADHIAAINIAARAGVERPIESENFIGQHLLSAPGSSPAL